MNSDPIFKLNGISKSYTMGEVQVHALTNVSLELYEHEFVVLLGASGSGKSTLLNILGGLDTPSAGSLFYKQLELSQASGSQLTQYRKDSVGFVFQFYNLISNLTAIENIELVTEIAQRPMSAKKSLDLVGMSDRYNHFPGQLSGGEQQRVSIARAIAKQPDILLCDEPTGALDVRTGKLVLQAIQKVNRELGTLVVIITHNAAIASIADRVIYLQDGQISKIETNLARKSLDEVNW